MAASRKENQKEKERERALGEKRAVAVEGQGCVAIITIAWELICVFVKRGREYHPSCSIPGVVWLHRHKYAWFLSSFLSFFPPLPCLIPLSPVFYPELLDSWGEVAFLSLLHLPASRSMIAPHTRHAHPQLYCVDRVVNYLLLSRLMKSNVFFFLAAAHLTLPSYPRTLPCSFSSAFCASPSSWNSGRKLTRKIGHPLVRLSPLRH